MKGIQYGRGIVIAVSVALLGFSALASAADKKIATVTIPVEKQLYAAEVIPLTAAQCGQCHTAPFGNLKKGGGRHQFACQKCHASFHTYSPKKGNWDAIMPRCESCHTALHGAAISDCATCHSDPHAPKNIGMSERLLNVCTTCHPGPKEQLDQFPSKHTKLGCQYCHTSHGLKPSCQSCHGLHKANDAEAAACAKCHSVHKPMKVTWKSDLPSPDCGWCHDKVFTTWSKTPSKHGTLDCVYCHADRHRFKPACTDCHSAPHRKEILARFPTCLGCHLDVHDLPVRKGSGKTAK